MPRFIKTYHKNETVIKRVLSCTTCPLMKYYVDDKACVCRQFSSKSTDKGGLTNVIRRFVVKYDKETGKISQKLEIPDWCGLDKTIISSYYNEDIYRISEKSINIMRIITTSEIKVIDSHNNRQVNIDLEALINDHKYDRYSQDYESTIKTSNYSIASNIRRAVQRENEDRCSFDDFLERQRRLNKQTEEKKDTDKCSLCGEDSKTVKRNERLGMCDKCWEESNDDTKRKAFINNFRLKRKVDFSDKSFKPIVELKIK